MANHEEALKLASRFLGDSFSESFLNGMHSVGHRVVHGLTISAPVLIECAAWAGCLGSFFGVVGGGAV